jgi:hypothetical protein
MSNIYTKEKLADHLKLASCQKVSVKFKDLFNLPERNKSKMVQFIFSFVFFRIYIDSTSQLSINYNYKLYLKTCTFFEQGNCAFRDECWFRHTAQTGQGSFLPQTLKEFKCGFCEKIFERKKS